MDGLGDARKTARKIHENGTKELRVGIYLIEIAKMGKHRSLRVCLGKELREIENGGGQLEECLRK